MGLQRFDLSGRVALVTGSSKGIGLAIAGALAGAGARVVLNARGASDLAGARDKLASEGHDVRAYAFDVADHAAVAAAVARIEVEVGAIDVLVNNAGTQRRMPLEDFPEEAWRELMAVNLDGPFFVSRAVVRSMIARGRGKIINVCSIMSEIARPSIGPYTTAKGGLKMLTKAMCAEWARYGIQVNGIGPGSFKTELSRPLVEDPNFDAWLKTRTPAGRWGELDELGGAAIFLASDASSFVNGHILYVDGGVTAVA